MLRLTIELGPDRSIKPRVVRQWTIVKIHRALGCQRQHAVRHDLKVRNTQKPIHRQIKIHSRQRAIIQSDIQPLPFGPIGDIAVLGQNMRHLVTCVLPKARAFDQE